jgi:membrane-associated phospholipid phosphatase
MAAAVMLWIGLSEFTFHGRAALLPAVGMGPCGLIALFYTYIRRDLKIAAMMTVLVQLLLFTFVGGPLSYLMASLGLPLWDATLFNWDRALGLDWRAYLDAVNASPLLGVSFTIAYQSIKLQMILAVFLLALVGRLRDLQVFAAAVVITGLITVLWSGLMPAMAMFVHLGLTAADYPNLSPAAAHVHVSAMEGLRNGSLRDIVPLTFEGIITFPSYHAALGVIFLRAFWSVPWVRWPGAVLNTAMIAATPIDGGHYFVDVLAGVAIAVIVLAVCYRLTQPSVVGRPFQSRQFAPSPA